MSCEVQPDGSMYTSRYIIVQTGCLQHEPYFSEETEDCEYVITWLTPHACPLKVGAGVPH